MWAPVQAGALPLGARELLSPRPRGLSRPGLPHPTAPASPGHRGPCPPRPPGLRHARGGEGHGAPGGCQRDTVCPAPSTGPLCATGRPGGQQPRPEAPPRTPAAAEGRTDGPRPRGSEHGLLLLGATRVRSFVGAAEDPGSPGRRTAGTRPHRVQVESLCFTKCTGPLGIQTGPSGSRTFQNLPHASLLSDSTPEAPGQTRAGPIPPFFLKFQTLRTVVRKNGGKRAPGWLSGKGM